MCVVNFKNKRVVSGQPVEATPLSVANLWRLHHMNSVGSVDG